MQISAVKLTLCKHGGLILVKVQFRFDLAAWAIESSSSNIDDVLRCLYSQPLDIVWLCQGLDRQGL